MARGKAYEKPMTPTEQDKELKSYIVEQLHSFDREEEMFDTYVNRFLQLITADRKRVALEARIDEINYLDDNFQADSQDWEREHPATLRL